MQFSGQKLAPITMPVGLSHVILHSRPLTIKPPAERGWAARTTCRARPGRRPAPEGLERRGRAAQRSEEHTSELQSLMRISYAVFCLKKKNNHYSSTLLTLHDTKGHNK